jgi:hypothetical protein
MRSTRTERLYREMQLGNCERVPFDATVQVAHCAIQIASNTSAQEGSSDFSPGLPGSLRGTAMQLTKVMPKKTRQGKCTVMLVRSVQTGIPSTKLASGSRPEPPRYLLV